MSPRLPTCAAVLLLLLGGCKDRAITAYRAPKDPAATLPPPAATANTNDLPRDHPPIGVTPAGPAMADTAVPTGSDRLTWTAPAAWAAQPPRPMRKASFTVKGDNGATADLSITSFPGDTGGLLANLNRWRGQLALAPLDGAALGAETVQIEAGGLHLTVVDFAGTANGAPARLLGAVVPFQGETWFFKLLGPDALVAKEKPAFLGFLKTITPR